MPILEIRRLTHSIENRLLANNLSFSLEPGKVLSIVGPSGCGKTTLLRLITGMISPQQAEIVFAGQTIHKKDILQFRKSIGFLFQSGALFTDLSVYENIAFPLRELDSLSEAIIRQKVENILEELSLGEAKNKMPIQLSGGMSRRVAFARAIIVQPRILFFDEPFTGQDPINKAIMEQLVAKSAHQNIAVLLVSHDIPEVLRLSNEIRMLYQGDFVFHGTPQDINEQSLNEVPRQFFYPAHATSISPQ